MCISNIYDLCCSDVNVGEYPVKFDKQYLPYFIPAIINELSFCIRVTANHSAEISAKVEALLNTGMERPC